jgi:hypothetical protein
VLKGNKSRMPLWLSGTIGNFTRLRRRAKMAAIVEKKSCR